eukprot:m.157473 g.157473  ORF g.157473 m.157473 type:complete len:96 (-) comp9810_c0_seq18:736-1023(-)
MGLSLGSGMGICSTLLCLLFLCIFWRYCLDRVRGRSGGSNGSGGSGGQNSVHITTAGDQQTVSKRYTLHIYFKFAILIACFARARARVCVLHGSN